jgi:hypothetical protein
MAKWAEEKKDRLLGYLRDELMREEQDKSQVIPDGTEKDFRDLLDFACTNPAAPVSPRAPKGKPETSSAPKAE